MTKDEAQQAIPRPPRRAAPVTVKDTNGKTLSTIDIGYDWREFDRYLQRLHALLGLFPDGDKAINLFTGHLDNQELIAQLETRAKIPGQDGQDGEDGYTYPPVKGDRGADGRQGQPGMDGESESEDFLMAPPGIGVDVLKIYFDALYGGIGSTHTRLHSIVDILDHSSTATSGKILKANANGLPVDATNTDTEVASAVSLKHTQGTDTALGVLGTQNPPVDADLFIYRASATAWTLVTSTGTQVKAFLKTYFDTIYFAITGQYYFAAAVNDDGTQALPTVTANYPAHGFIHVCTTTTIVESAEFEYGSDGNVQIIRGTTNVVVNADTDGKVCLGTAASQNPLTIKNRLGGARQVMITLWYK